MVLQTGDWSLGNTTMIPSDYYNQYLNELNNSGLKFTLKAEDSNLNQAVDVQPLAQEIDIAQ